jgi:uncharacterized integral membrane protein
MSDDAGHGRLGGTPAQGNVGPADPSADPVTDPGVRLPVPAEQPTAPAPVGEAAPGPTATGPTGGPATGTAPALRRSRTGVVWVGLIFSALVLLLLLVFIVQNDVPVQISFFTLEGVLPSGVALLLAAIAGILLGAIPGSLRIFQLRRAARRAGRPRD